MRLRQAGEEGRSKLRLDWRWNGKGESSYPVWSCPPELMLFQQHFTSTDHTIKQRNGWVTFIEHDCMDHCGMECIGSDLLNVVAWKHCDRVMHWEADGE